MKRFISLGGGEPEYTTPNHIIDAMKNALDDGFTHYGSFRHIPELRTAVTKKYEKFDVKADPEHIIITPGSTMGIYLVFHSLLNKGDEILTMDPCFFGYFGPLGQLGINAVPVPRYKEENWAFHPNDLYELITPKTKALLICSPDNPTGSVLKEADLKAIADFAIEKDIMIISDDIYDEITYDGVKFKSIASLQDMKERTVILNGLSKTYAMTGWRVGYILAPDQDIYDKLFALQMNTFLVINEAVQRASLAALSGPQDCVKEMVSKYDEKRKYVYDMWLDTPGVEVTNPEGAFYMFPDLSSYGLSSDRLAKYIRDNANVAITSGKLFGSKGEGHIRNAFAQSIEDLEEGLGRIKQVLGKL
jgi:aminotransferase